MAYSPHLIAQWIAAANAANTRGDHVAAIRICEQVITAMPHVPEAWFNLALAQGALGKRDDAIKAAKNAGALTRQSAEAQNGVGLLLLQLDAVQEARACFERAIALSPDHPIPHCNLGQLQAQAGMLVEAESSFRRAIALQPDLAPAHANLCGVLNIRGLHQAAEAAGRRAVALDAGSAEGWTNLGSALLALGRYAAAEAACRKAVELTPRSSEAWTNLALAEAGQGQPRAAEAACRRAIELDPQSAEAWQSLGDILSRVGQTQAAEDALRKAVELDPVLSTARIRLADVLISQFRLNEAEDACRKGIELDPASAAPHATLAEIAAQRWDFAQADSHYRSALEQEPHNLRVLSHRLFQLNYAPATEPMEAVAAALDYGQAARRDIAPFSDWTCSREPRRQLRVGMVSGDFGRHPVGMFLKAPLRQVDRMGFELFGYSCNAIDDDVTAELKQSFSVWRNAAGLDDAELARRIRDDGIDILIDLSGHTEAGRLSVFAWRSAPVQATWLGYFATTGLREVDWKLGDPFVTPIGEEHHFVERIWRLPGCCYCFDPPSDAPDVGELPSANAGRVTYGCFNNLAKLNDPVVALWSRVLAADRDATLFLKAKQLSSKELALALAARFARHGIGADRLVLEGSARYADYLAAYGRVDIALDPFPYTGGTTTVEGLWMGVPVVTLKGDRYLAHQGESLLHAAGLPDWIALDPDDYVDKALRLAADRSRLAKLRAELRTQVSASSLCDAARFCRGLEDAWRGMWQTWCDA